MPYINEQCVGIIGALGSDDGSELPRSLLRGLSQRASSSLSMELRVSLLMMDVLRSL
jgi:hypothetical protein